MDRKAWLAIGLCPIRCTICKPWAIGLVQPLSITSILLSVCRCRLNRFGDRICHADITTHLTIQGVKGWLLQSLRNVSACLGRFEKHAKRMNSIIKGMRAARLSSPLYFTCCRSFYFFHGEIGFGLPVFGQHFLADLFHHSRFAFCVFCRKRYEL